MKNINEGNNPRLDVFDGRVLKRVKFKGLRDTEDIVELASWYYEQEDDEIVFLVESSLNSENVALDLEIGRCRGCYLKNLFN